MTRLLLPAAALLAACTSLQPSGPGAAELQGLIAKARPGVAPEVRNVRCEFIVEEGSEWRCRYEQRASDGGWVPLQTFVAADGSGWVLIDGVADPNMPPPA